MNFVSLIARDERCQTRIAAMGCALGGVAHSVVSMGFQAAFTQAEVL